MEKNPEEPPDNKNFLKKEGVLIEPQKKNSSFLFAKKILIEPKIVENGIRINVGGKNFKIVYPKEFWEKYPFPLKKSLSENLAYIFTLHLPLLFGIDTIVYDMEEIPSKNLIFQAFLKSLPATALNKSKKTSQLLKKILQTKYLFNKERNSINKERNSIFSSHSESGKNTALLLFSFGKDSLLTYGLCREIGIKTVLFYVKEPLSPLEDYNKEILAKKFFEEFGQKIVFIKNELGKLRDYENNDGYGWELNLAQFGLIGLPIAYAKKVDYLFYSNEQSCNLPFLDPEGFLGYPAYDQTVEWMLKLQKIVKMLGMENLKIGSIIEPLHDLLITRILHHRYPEIAKYQMSCGEDLPSMKEHRWCGNCSKCARIFIILLANKINPKNLDFPTNMLQMEFKEKFTIFNGGDNKISSTYDKIKVGRDEQLLAFYLAYKNGSKGKLIDLFKKLYLREAKKRERELKEKFFRIHPSITLPNELKGKILKIFKEEIKNFE